MANPSENVAFCPECRGNGKDPEQNGMVRCPLCNESGMQPVVPGRPLTLSLHPISQQVIDECFIEMVACGRDPAMVLQSELLRLAAQRANKRILQEREVREVIELTGDLRPTDEAIRQAKANFRPKQP